MVAGGRWSFTRMRLAHAVDVARRECQPRFDTGNTRKVRRSRRTKWIPADDQCITTSVGFAAEPAFPRTVISRKPSRSARSAW